MKVYHTALLAGFLLLAHIAPAQTATALYNEGVELKNDSKIEEALDKFKKAIALQPNYAEALYESGWCMNDLQDYSGALTNLRKARNLWNNVPKVFFELGYAFEKLSKTDSAIACYNRCLALKPDYSTVFKQLGYIAYVKEDYDGALVQFAKYEDAAPSEIEDYFYWYRKGYAMNSVPDYEGALTALKKSLEFKTDYSSTYLELGYAAYKLGRDDEAIDYYKKAIEIDPKDHVPYNGIAEVYRDSKEDMTEAMSWYLKTLAFKPKERKANYGMGYCLNSEGKYSEAVPYLNTAVTSEPNYPAAFVELEYAYYMQGKYADALENYRKAVGLSPKNENARYYAGLVYIQQKNKAMAQKMVDELKALSSKSAAKLQAKVDAL